MVSKRGTREDKGNKEEHTIRGARRRRQDEGRPVGRIVRWEYFLRTELVNPRMGKGGTLI